MPNSPVPNFDSAKERDVPLKSSKMEHHGTCVGASVCSGSQPAHASVLHYRCTETLVVIWD